MFITFGKFVLEGLVRKAATISKTEPEEGLKANTGVTRRKETTGKVQRAEMVGLSHSVGPK